MPAFFKTITILCGLAALVSAAGWAFCAFKGAKGEPVTSMPLSHFPRLPRLPHLLTFRSSFSTSPHLTSPLLASLHPLLLQLRMSLGDYSVRHRNASEAHMLVYPSFVPPPFTFVYFPSLSLPLSLSLSLFYYFQPLNLVRRSSSCDATTEGRRRGTPEGCA